MNGSDLLGEFRKTRSDAAFGGLVRMYANLVYSVAMRRLSNAAQAEEVAQIVFIRLATNPPNLPGEAQLAGWLHRTTVYVAVDLWRKETRRRAREEQAVTMQPDHTENTAWHEMAPALDEALNELSDPDRHALLMRFFDGKTMRDLGLSLGVSEDAAKMRVSRALEKLRRQLSGRGVACSGVILGAMLSERSIEAAPAGLVEALSALKIPALGAGATAGLLSFFLHVSKAKVAVGLTALVLAGAVTVTLLQTSGQKSNTTKSNALAAAADATKEEKQPVTAAAALEETNYFGADGQPDPRKLLQIAINARKKIVSGTMELSVSSFHSSDNSTETNRAPTIVTFDSGKSRFESFSSSRSHTGYDLFSKDELAKIKDKVAQGLLTEDPDKSGYLETNDDHEVSIFDGAVIMSYSDGKGQSKQTKIEEPSRSGADVFDPRCLGLNPSLDRDNTLESLAERCRDVQFSVSVPKEEIEGTPAWHVHLETKDHELLDFWLDAANPGRVLKSSYHYALSQDLSVSLSKFNRADPGDSMPDAVTVIFYRKGSILHQQTFTRMNAKFNVPVDPATWTLVGLNMPIGIDVVDYRSSRRLGYWTGAGLSENLPTKKGKSVKKAALPDLAAMLASLEKNPSSRKSLENAVWIILNTPDGPSVDKAAEVIIQEHLHSTNLLVLCKELARIRPRSANKLLQAVLEYNPDTPTRAAACYSLAQMTKSDAKGGKDKVAFAAADRLFDQLVSEFGKVKSPGGSTYRELGEGELLELRHASIGQPAPEIEGLDLDGHKMKLSDFRGKTVALIFWSRDGGHAENLKDLIASQTGKPFAVVGVCCEISLAEARHIVEQWDIAWPSFQDQSITKYWNNHGWPEACVIDPNGIILARDVAVSNGEIEVVVKKLMEK